MESLGFPSNWITRPIIVLLAFAIAFFLGSGLLLRFRKASLGISRAQKDDTDYSAGKEKMTARSLHEIQTIDIKLDSYSLDIQKRNGLLKKTPRLSILKSLSTTFEPGVLNVIMGPSGSGKTSLLNSMAYRLHNSTSTKYETAGKMLFNGAVPSEKVVRSICSYVCQDDDALLPYLTVRENLHFSAGLRLPAHLSNHEKLQRAEAVLLKMGLRDCANNLVGSEMVKGISGGEKRRVTIAIQILTDPRILFLDEPTSGLDAFTASSIIEVLRALADEGRTLVLTIHQSRSDLFKHFRNVLLLARGGSPVYAGKGNLMLNHFAALGFECPTTTNPADFALDLITVNLQNETKESTSREKVRSLIIEWDQSQAPLHQSISHIATPAELGSLARSMTPFRISFPLLLHRSFVNFRRNPPSIVARTTQILGYAICVTLFFAPLKNDYYSVQTRLGFVQDFAPLYFVGMLQNVAVYPDEKAVFYREHDDNAYSVEAFFLQYTLAEIPFEICTCLVFAVLMDLAVGLHRTASLFFIVAFNAFCIVNCGESVGIIFNTLFDHTGFAVNVTSVVLSIAQIMGGVMSLNIPAFLQAFNHLSPIKWAIGNLAPYTLAEVTFSCTQAQRLPNGQCPVTNGEDVLNLYNLNGNAGLNLLALGICVVVYRMLAFLILKAKRTRWAWKERLGWGRSRGGNERVAPSGNSALQNSQ
jgi:ABC-type multidrug transport system ATPase subunit